MEASALNREEQKELMGLLGLDCSCWGALPVMRRAYLRKCLEYHPDKGGDEAKMKRMSELYRRVTEGLREVGPEQDWTWSTQEVSERVESSAYMERWGFCNKDLQHHTCNCLMCTLRKCHNIRKKHKRLVWLVCYCYECFRMWFGMDNVKDTYLAWKEIIAATPYCNLQIW
ncbi:small T antigen [Lepus polyomavirus 1]|uniref:Small t antigen n=1 Tax=Lepus polyomavirus 1 TaxID=2716316 RepID=A0A6G7NP94_9POLY|nr:small T antigen [Lepus polyomavirus 1]QIJ55569.1 small T antigen [Lepus polyomavirus 1]QIJ55574.1 small T antigen [Lepus polyomavirus 1]